jgi:hypothetical protein
MLAINNATSGYRVIDDTTTRDKIARTSDNCPRIRLDTSFAERNAQ